MHGRLEASVLAERAAPRANRLIGRFHAELSVLALHGNERTMRDASDRQDPQDIEPAILVPAQQDGTPEPERFQVGIKIDPLFLPVARMPDAVNASGSTLAEARCYATFEVV
jgi:hypothetical protein